MDDEARLEAMNAERDFQADTVEAYKALSRDVQALIKRTSHESEDLKYRIELLEAGRIDAEEQQTPKPPRIRIKWNQLANREWRPELTYEGEGLGDYPQAKLDADMAVTLAESDKLKAELESRS